MKTKRDSKFKQITILVTAAMLAVLLMGCGKESPEPTAAVPETTVPQETQAEMSISELLAATLTLKDDLETAVDHIKEDDIDSAREKLGSVTKKTETVRKSLNATMASIGDSIPSMQKELKNMQGLLDLVDTAAEKLLYPAMDHMQAHPFEDMRAGDGVSTKGIWEYIDFIEGLMPDVTELVEQANTVDLSLVDSDGEIAGYLETINELLEMYQQDSTIFARLKRMFGAEGDRLYLVAAQNSAEIRASGGFPGAVGTILIQDGVLTMGDFQKVYDVLYNGSMPAAKVTALEGKLFPGGMAIPRDADYCPDFERVGYIWALGYETRQRETVDGVISVTPAIVQKILAVLDQEVKLFDGTVLTGDNAVKELQHDMYFKYFGKQTVAGAATTADQLFADAAKKASQLMMENMSAATLLEYASIAGDCFEARELMLWMQDEAEQELVRKLRWNGGLAVDPEYPQAGIYYSCTVASKMGWYLVRDVQIGDQVKNEDGSYTYPMTVTLSNALTEEERREASQYILGVSQGSLLGNAYFFAPAGGTVSNFEASNGKTIQTETYNGLQLGYIKELSLRIGQPVTITYDLTTAPGVEAPLTLSMTPTVQEYH